MMRSTTLRTAALLTATWLGASRPAVAGGGEVTGEEPEFAPTQPPVAEPAPPAAPVEEAPPAPVPTPPGELPRGKGTRTIGGDVIGVLPFGEWAGGDAGEFVTFAVGVLGRFTYGLSDRLALTVRAGVVYNLPAVDDLSVLMIPVMGGVTYDLSITNVFLYGDLGLNFLRASRSGLDSSNTRLQAGFGGGYRFGRLDGRAGIWMPGSIGDGDTLRTLWGLQLSVGYDYTAL